MPSGLVLVIEDDEWVQSLLASAIHIAGYDVAVSSTAKAGLETACSVQPDCIICDVDLPDHDGYWVARNVRTHPSRVSVTPFLFLSALDDQASRLEGFHVGADVYMTKPFRVDEVVAQVGALVQMASRLRVRRDSLLAMPDSSESAGSAIEGDLSQMSIATVLTVLEMERRSGTFEVVSKKRRAQLEIAAGYVVDGRIGGTRCSALTAMRTMLGWQVGRFSFVPSASREPPTARTTIGAFLIEAVRLDDEDTRADLDLPPSRRRPELARLSAPVLGGPASRPDDLAPSSSRAPGPRESARPISIIPISSDPSEVIDVELEHLSIEPDPPSMRAPALIGMPSAPVAAPIPPPLKVAAIPPPKPSERPKRPSMRPAMNEVKIPPPPHSPTGLKPPPRPPRPEPKKR